MKSRNLATISLAVMACGFLLTLFLPDNLAVVLLRGGFEAGLVGDCRLVCGYRTVPPSAGLADSAYLASAEEPG